MSTGITSNYDDGGGNDCDYDDANNNNKKLKSKLRGLSAGAKYTDRATTACRRR
jgi:hypothetical protein